MELLAQKFCGTHQSGGGLCAGKFGPDPLRGCGAERGFGERSPRGFRFAKTNLRARSMKSRRIERVSLRRARGSTSTSQNRLRSLRRNSARADCPPPLNGRV